MADWDRNALQKLKDEINNDPLTRSYSGMTNQQIADSLNTANRTISRAKIDSADLYESIDLTEYNALTAGSKTEINNFLGMGTLVTSVGSRTRNRIITIFGVNSTTVANLAALVNSTVSRATELGLLFVGAHHVADAKALS